MGTVLEWHPSIPNDCSPPANKYVRYENIDTEGFNTNGSGGIFAAALSNLTAGSQYDVWVMATRENFSAGQTVAIKGATTTTFTQTDVNTKDLLINSSVGSSAQNFDSYALLVTASNTGTIEVDITGGTAGFAISGLAIEAAAVPLPSAAWAGLLLLGGIGAAKLRRQMA
jgi:hypothetical protein